MIVNKGSTPLKIGVSGTSPSPFGSLDLQDDEKTNTEEGNEE